MKEIKGGHSVVRFLKPLKEGISRAETMELIVKVLPENKVYTCKGAAYIERKNCWILVGEREIDYERNKHGKKTG